MVLKIGDVCVRTPAHMKLLILRAVVLSPYIKVSTMGLCVEAGGVVTERCLRRPTPGKVLRHNLKYKDYYL